MDWNEESVASAGSSCSSATSPRGKAGKWIGSSRSIVLLALPLALAIGFGSVVMGQAADSLATTRTAVSPTSAAVEPVPVPEPSNKAMQYYRSGNVLWIVNQLWGLAVPALVLFTGLSARLRDASRAMGRKWFFVILVYFILYNLLNYVLDLPLAYYAGFVRQHAYGLSRQSLGKWFSDSLKGLVVGTIAGCLFLWVPYLLLRVSPRRWWLYTSLAVMPLMFLAVMVVPIWVAPWFNKFAPMQDRALEARILALAERAGIEGGRVFEVEKSADTKTVNAYVTGVWNTKRIVLWDTLLKKLAPEEVLAVMAHEMGHYVLNHVVIGIWLGCVGVLISLYAVYRLAGLMIRRFQGRFGFAELSDVASFPLILLLVQVVSLAIEPAGLAFSRHIEREADRFGLELTRDNHAAATSFVKLQHENLSNPRPGPLFIFWRASHPPLGERIEFANTYRPWERGQPLRYEAYVRNPPAESDRGR